MDRYVMGETIRRLRTEKGLTQTVLAERINVSDKAVSKWETGKGYPDITLIEPLSAALGVTTVELLSGSEVRNPNRSCNMLRAKFYVCPVCGNVVYSLGESVVACHGIVLPPLVPEEEDESHRLEVTLSDDEYFVTARHEMTKTHYISFIAAQYDDSVRIVKLYPEGNAEGRFSRSRLIQLYFFCNKDGFFQKKIR